MHVPEGADPNEIVEAVRDKLGEKAGLKLLGGMPRSPLLRRLHLDEITGALSAAPIAGTAGTDADVTDVDVSKVNATCCMSREKTRLVAEPRPSMPVPSCIPPWQLCSPHSHACPRLARVAPWLRGCTGL